MHHFFGTPCRLKVCIWLHAQLTRGNVVVEERDGAGRGGDTNAAMLPMTSSQVHLWSIGLWMLIGVLIISPTAGGGGLGRLRCNVDSEGGKYTSASPRCTCLPPRQHCAEVALGAFTTDSSAMLTRREASTPRLRLDVLASLLVNIALKLHSEESKYTSATPRCTCFPPRATSTQVPLVQVQVPPL